jgi:hypothetical protein
MQVLDFLAAVGTDVRERPVATLADAQLLRDLNNEPKKRLTVYSRSVVEETGAIERIRALGGVKAPQLVQRDDVFPRHYEHMLGGLGVEVTKGDEIRVF